MLVGQTQAAKLKLSGVVTGNKHTIDVESEAMIQKLSKMFSDPPISTLPADVMDVLYGTLEVDGRKRFNMRYVHLCEVTLTKMSMFSPQTVP